MKEETHIEHGASYGLLIITWLGLLALTGITVTVAGINLGAYSLLVGLTVAAIKSFFVINIFMHIKYEQPIFKVFLVLSSFTLIVIFILTLVDFIYR